MEAKSLDEWGIFKIFTSCPNDPKTLILDVRPHKSFKRMHINQAYCVRLSSNGKVLADYSHSSYSMPWSQHCWWGKPVVVYGPASLGKDHPVVQFLVNEGRCTSVHYYKAGYDVFESKMPYLCTPSVKANSMKKYPSVILPGFLFLGDWSHAENHERLKEIKIKRIVTIHNHPENLKVQPGIRHLQITLADVEGADISPHFNSVYEFIADAERLKQPVLVHCGAGVSRSACMVIMYLMRSKLWSAQQSRDYCIAARSLVCPNDGFWRVLCALEGPLGILNRSDPDATMGFAGADAPDVKLDKQAAGLPVTVRMITAKELEKQQEAQAAAEAAAIAAAEKAAAMAAAAADAERAQEKSQRLRRGREHSRSKSRSRSRGSSSTSSGSTTSSSSTSSSSSSDTSSGSSENRSRSRSVDRNKPRHRSRSRDRAGGGQSEAAVRPPLRRGRARSSSRSRSKDKGGSRHRRSSRSTSRDRVRRRSRSRSKSRERKRSRWSPSAAAAAAGQRGAAAGPAAATWVGSAVGEQKPAAGPSGWLVTIEVSKPGGVVGHLVIGPMTVHQRVIFGRAPGCGVLLEHMSISRQHAQLSVDMAGAVTIKDLGAVHGTKLNDTWIKKEQLRSLPVGGTLQFGASTRTYKLLSVEKA